MKRRSAYLVAALALYQAGCGQNYVRVDDVALGRVVVYRNGVAYYERRATVSGDELSMLVPRDKVDDFLKSLTVADARTGDPLPVTFSRTDGSGDIVDMVIRLPKSHSTDLILTYITESPAWKPSYRVVANDDGSVVLQSWAVVDNTSAETWKDVIVGVGSSAALSFRYDLFSVRDVQRATLASDERLAIAPPSGSSPHGGAGSPDVLLALGDDQLGTASATTPTQPSPRADLPAEPMAARESLAPAADSGGYGGYRASTKSAKERARDKKVQAIQEARRRQAVEAQQRAEAERQRNEQQLVTMAQSLRKSGKKVVINGYAAPQEDDARQRSLDRANQLRNRLISVGVPPAQLEVQGNGAVAGKVAGIELVSTNEDVVSSTAAKGSGDDKPVGESHFQSSGAMTVKAGSSAMVSLLKHETKGSIVYLYDAESDRGNDRFAFRALRFINPTKNTLEAGPVTVYREGGFIGEGLTEPIPPESAAIVPFALDRQIVVNREQESRDRISRLVAIERGIARAEVSHTRSRELTLTNRLNKPATVYVRHTVEPGWKLSRGPRDVERLGNAHLFRVVVPARSSGHLVIEERTPLEKTLDLRNDSGIAMLELYLADAKDADSALASKLQEVLTLHRAIADQELAIETQRKRLDDYRVRMDELHAQIVTLKAVRSGGALMKHLGLKMQGISDLVQRATIEVVEAEEKLMIARVRFNDALAELTLGQRSKVAKNGAAGAE